MLKNISITTLILAFLGFLDATYLTIVHYKNLTVPCSIAHGCETVLTSKYATIGSIPISLLGVGYYVVVMILAGILLQGKKSIKIFNFQFSIFNVLFLFTGLGLLIGLFLVYLQAFVLHAYCQYCLGSEVVDLLLFVCAAFLFNRSKTSTQA
jgi:uncharacterized membrane protein